MPRTVASNDYERDLLTNIEKYGWQSTSVLGEKGSPGFSYIIGMFQSYGFPELIILGLPAKIAHAIFSRAAKAAASGEPVPLDKPSDRLIAPDTCEFRRVPVAKYGEYVLSARWYYQGDNFPLYQLVWPCERGLFPWDPTATQAFRAEQPTIGTNRHDA